MPTSPVARWVLMRTAPSASPFMRSVMLGLAGAGWPAAVLWTAGTAARVAPASARLRTRLSGLTFPSEWGVMECCGSDHSRVTLGRSGGQVYTPLGVRPGQGRRSPAGRIRRGLVGVSVVLGRQPSTILIVNFVLLGRAVEEPL